VANTVSPRKLTGIVSLDGKVILRYSCSICDAAEIGEEGKSAASKSSTIISSNFQTQKISIRNSGIPRRTESSNSSFIPSKVP
jgi:hypothetical protein